MNIILPSTNRQEILPTLFRLDIHPLPKVATISFGLILSRMFFFTLSGRVRGSGVVISTPPQTIRCPVACFQMLEEGSDDVAGRATGGFPHAHPQAITERIVSMNCFFIL